MQHGLGHDPHASRRQVLEASASMAVLATGPTAGEALAAQSSGQPDEEGKAPPPPSDLTHMRAHW